MFIGPVCDCSRGRDAGHHCSLSEDSSGLPSEVNYCYLRTPLLWCIRVVLIPSQAKRHHTRFFPTQEKDADNKGNPLPGTVVDRGITSVYHFDFFLQGILSLK